MLEAELKKNYTNFYDTYRELPISGPREMEVFQLLSDSVGTFINFFDNIDFNKIDFDTFDKLLVKIQEILLDNSSIISNSDNSPINKFQDTIYDFFSILKENNGQ